MRNIISGKTLAEAVAEGGLQAAQQFPSRCTGHTTGAALSYIGQVMKKQKDENGAVSVIWVEGSEVRELIPALVEKLGLKGFRMEKGCDGGRLYYRAFEGD
nr:MAG TPA: hypothetical protein [Caudoviricetes sp.]